MDMRNVMLAGALALSVLSPWSASAQQQVAVPPTIEGVSTAKVLAIGIGALLGAVAAQALVAGEGVTLVGGLAGGVLGAWWYENSSAAPVRAALREPAAPALARAQRLALAR
jgi:hypothetical protein